MARFAKIGLNNKVIAVHSVHNNELKDANGVEEEKLGIDFLTELYGWAIWKQTSYNNNFRKNHAVIGFTYDEDRNAFIAPKPYNSWIVNETTCQWEAPVAKPDSESGEKYEWSDDSQSWILIDNS